MNKDFLEDLKKLMAKYDCKSIKHHIESFNNQIGYEGVIFNFDFCDISVAKHFSQETNLQDSFIQE